MELNINPYPEIGSFHASGLSYIKDNINGHEEELNAIICQFINDTFGYDIDNHKLDKMELSSIFTIAMNAFINNEYPTASELQMPFINLLINGIKSTPPMEVDKYIVNIEDEITKSNLSQQEKMPLFFATSIGQASVKYWFSILENPGDWGNYISNIEAVNIASLPYWVSAAIQATLYFCFKGSYSTTEEQPPKMAGPDIITALTASLAVGAGKVVFGWVPKVNIMSINSPLFNPLNNDEDINLTQKKRWKPSSGNLTMASINGLSTTGSTGHYVNWLGIRVSKDGFLGTDQIDCQDYGTGPCSDQ